MSKVIPFLFFIIVLTNACKKLDDPNSQSENTISNNNNLKEVFSETQTLLATTVPGYFDIKDFTVEGDLLHLVYGIGTPRQQGINYTMYRRSKNMTTNLLVPQPKGADTSFADYLIQNDYMAQWDAYYLPYKNFFTFCQSGSRGASKYIDYKADMKMSMGYPANYIADMGFRFPVGNIIKQIHSDNGTGYIGAGVFNPSYTFSQYTGTILEFQNMSFNYMPIMFTESFRNNFQDSIVGLAWRQDSIVAYSFSVGFNDRRNVPKKLTAIKNVPDVPVFDGQYSKRHYDETGNKLSLMLFRENRYLSTFTYNFSSNTISLGLNDFDLQFPADRNLFDTDEEGNVYYISTNASGKYIIYKIDVAGNRTTIADNILKYGSPLKLKYLKGKVYVAAWGKAADGKTYMKILRQQ